jgi:hypothetical protein
MTHFEHKNLALIHSHGDPEQKAKQSWLYQQEFVTALTQPTSVAIGMAQSQSIRSALLY